MRIFVQHNADLSDMGPAVEVQHDMQLRAPEDGYSWTELPGPLGMYELALVDGVPEPRLRMVKVRQAKWEEVKAKRAAIQCGGCVTPHAGIVDTDEESRMFIHGLVSLADIASKNAQSFSALFTPANNVDVELDATQTVEMGVAVALHVADAHAVARQLHSQIFDMTVTDPAVIAAIDVEAAPWPVCNPHAIM